MPYTVFVGDNCHYQREEEVSTDDTFGTPDEAIARCKQIVESEMRDYLKQGFPVRELAGIWCCFGDDPWIKPDVGFSARNYAEEFSQQLAEEQQ